MEYKFAHQKTELSQSFKMGLIQNPNKYILNTNGLQQKTHIRTKWQNTQIELHTQKRNFPWSRGGGQGTAGLIRSCSSLTHPDASFCFTRENSKLAAVLSKEETGRLLKTSGFSTCQEYSTKSLSQGQLVITERWLHGHHPCALQGPAALPWKSREPNVARAQQSHTGSPILFS